jgi:hypothetical protein
MTIHLALLCSWTCYLTAKWRMYVNSQSSHTLTISFLEILLAVPDLFALLEFTILLMSTPIPPRHDSRSALSTISSDATVHALITCVHSNHLNNTSIH